MCHKCREEAMAKLTPEEIKKAEELKHLIASEGKKLFDDHAEFVQETNDLIQTARDSILDLSEKFLGKMLELTDSADGPLDLLIATSFIGSGIQTATTAITMSLMALVEGEKVVSGNINTELIRLAIEEVNDEVGSMLERLASEAEAEEPEAEKAPGALDWSF